MDGAPLLEVRDVVNRFGTQTVHDGVNLTVNAGEIVGLVGGSGSGKSVLLRTMAGLHVPTSGSARVNGTPAPELVPRARVSTLGVLFQQGALFSGLTVLENVMVPLNAFSGLPRRACEEIARMKLRLAGLPDDAAAKHPAALSGGMIKRAALARAMAMDPKILFLDEPTAGLDPLAADAFDDLVRGLNRTLGLTFVMVTHDLDTLFATCHRVAVLVDRTLTVGTPDAMAEATHPWIHAYFHGPRSRAAQTAATRKGVTRGA